MMHTQFNNIVTYNYHTFENRYLQEKFETPSQKPLQKDNIENTRNFETSRFNFSRTWRENRENFLYIMMQPKLSLQI